MADRLPTVGAVGGYREGHHASAVGWAVAKAGCILLIDGGERNDTEVRNAAVRGCLAERRSASIEEIRATCPMTRRQIVWQVVIEAVLVLRKGESRRLRASRPRAAVPRPRARAWRAAA